MYGVCFVLFALSTYYHATRDDTVGSLATTLFESISDKRLISDGGVFPEGYEIDDFRTELAKPQNVLGHNKGRRSVNAHIHMVEALTAYHALVAKKSNDAELIKRSATALERPYRAR